MGLKEIKVNECYDDYKLSEGISVIFTSAGLEMLATFDRPTQKEIDMFQNGRIELRVLMYQEKLPYVIIKFQNSQFMDCPLIIHEDITEDDLREIEKDMGYALNIILADNNNGQVKVLRLIGLEHDFSEIVRKMVIKAGKMELNEALRLAKEVQKFPTKALWDRATYHINKKK